MPISQLLNSPNVARLEQNFAFTSIRFCRLKRCQQQIDSFFTRAKGIRHHQITSQIVLTKKLRGQQKEKSRISCQLSGGGVGDEGIKVNLATDRHLRTNTKRSRIKFAVTSLALSLGHRW